MSGSTCLTGPTNSPSWMIKIFRHFRQRLLNEKRLGRYLLYAIGEIVLVVIGILLALQINTWNEERKDDRLKNTYLEALVADLRSDLVNLKAWTMGNDDAEEEGLYLLDFLENRMAVPDSQRLARSFLMSQYKPAITLSSSTYRDLTNSGNMRIFTDLAFKKLLDEYYKVDTWALKIDDRITQTIWYDFRDEITELIDPSIFKAIYSSGLRSTEIEKLDLLRYDINWHAIQNSPELLRHLRSTLAFRVVIRGELHEHIERADNLLMVLERPLIN